MPSRSQVPDGRYHLRSLGSSRRIFPAVWNCWFEITRTATRGWEKWARGDRPTSNWKKGVGSVQNRIYLPLSVFNLSYHFWPHCRTLADLVGARLSCLPQEKLNLQGNLSGGLRTEKINLFRPFYTAKPKFKKCSGKSSKGHKKTSKKGKFNLEDHLGDLCPSLFLPLVRNFHTQHRRKYLCICFELRIFSVWHLALKPKNPLWYKQKHTSARVWETINLWGGRGGTSLRIVMKTIWAEWDLKNIGDTKKREG